MNEATIPTWNLLPSLRFRPDSRVRFSDIHPGLSLDFGNFKLSAAALISPYSGEIVSFSGILATPDTLADVHFEMPRKVESLRQWPPGLSGTSIGTLMVLSNQLAISAG